MKYWVSNSKPWQNKTIEDFVTGSAVLTIYYDMVNKIIAIRKTKKIKLLDAIIAATALVYDLILISRNVPDFSSIDGIKIINPWEK